MIKKVATGWMGSDETYPYKAIMDRPYTVKEFVDEVVADKDNWGAIDVIDSSDNQRNVPLCEYHHGEIDKPGMKVGYEDRLVKSARGSGGWSMYDFTLVI